MSQINSILDIISSKTDRAGNRYFAFRYTRCSDGKQVKATISGGESNINAITFHLNGKNWEPHDTYITNHELTYSAFKELTDDWAYAGSNPEELAKWVTNNLAK